MMVNKKLFSLLVFSVLVLSFFPMVVDAANDPCGGLSPTEITLLNQAECQSCIGYPGNGASAEWYATLDADGVTRNPIAGIYCVSTFPCFDVGTGCLEYSQEYCQGTGDTNPTYVGGIPDTCDGTDNDCDGTVDEGTTEVCNDGTDNDCDGLIDEGCAAPDKMCYYDKDNDNYGGSFAYDPITTENLFVTCPSGTIEVGGDCNDNNAAINPGATEISGDGIDNNCDGVKEGETSAYFATKDDITQKYSSTNSFSTAGDKSIYLILENPSSSIMPPTTAPPTSSPSLITGNVVSDAGWSFEIKERDSFTLNDDVRKITTFLVDQANNRLIYEWDIDSQDVKNMGYGFLGDNGPYDVYFEAKKEGETTIESLPHLTLYWTGTICKIDKVNWSEESTFEGLDADMNVFTTGCTPGKTVSFTLEGDAPVSPPSSVVLDSNGNAVGTWTTSLPSGTYSDKFKFEANIEGVKRKSGDLEVLGYDGEGIIECKNYDVQQICNGDPVEVADYSFELINDQYTCGENNLDCYCIWEQDSCDVEGKWSFGTGNDKTPAGTCNWKEGLTTGSCQTDSQITTQWVGTWVWDIQNRFSTMAECESLAGVGKCVLEGTTYYADPESAKPVCDAGVTQSYSCAAQIQLPGEHIYGIIAAIALIVLFYILIENNIKRHEKKSKKKVATKKKTVKKKAVKKVTAKKVAKKKTVSKKKK